MISEGEAIWYIEYLDHARTDDLDRLDKKPVKLWCTGKIAKETDEYLAVICSGAINDFPTSEPIFEVIFKPAIVKKELIKTV